MKKATLTIEAIVGIFLLVIVLFMMTGFILKIPGLGERILSFVGGGLATVSAGVWSFLGRLFYLISKLLSGISNLALGLGLLGLLLKPGLILRIPIIGSFLRLLGTKIGGWLLTKIGTAVAPGVYAWPAWGMTLGGIGVGIIEIVGGLMAASFIRSGLESLLSFFGVPNTIAHVVAGAAGGAVAGFSIIGGAGTIAVALGLAAAGPPGWIIGAAIGIGALIGAIDGFCGGCIVNTLNAAWNAISGFFSGLFKR
jgi:hypothetical protein